MIDSHSGPPQVPPAPERRPAVSPCAPVAWIAVLKCGCEYRTPRELRPGDWIGCTSLKHQKQQRVVRVVPVSSVPGPGEIGIQGELWDAA